MNQKWRLKRDFPKLPGVYLMKNQAGEILYVGKAKRLASRLANYYSQDVQKNGGKTAYLVSQIDSIETIVTDSEVEALLLEQSLIKQHQPKFNVLLRDDKSYPFVKVSNDDFPLIKPAYLGKRWHEKISQGRYFGPYTKGIDLKQVLVLMQSVFKLRTCSNHFFKTRRKPCLKYQINYCSAPCVGYISESDYQSSVNDSIMLLSGKSNELLTQMNERMAQASQAQQFETAAFFRDQIKRIHSIMAHPNLEQQAQYLDVWTLVQQAGFCCIYLLKIREGQIRDYRCFFAENQGESPSDLLHAHVMPYYFVFAPNLSDRAESIVIDWSSDERKLLKTALMTRYQKRVQVKNVNSKPLRKWFQVATKNAFEKLRLLLLEKEEVQIDQKILEDLLKQSVNRLGCFDISHSAGKWTRSSFVYAENGRMNKKQYRLYTIKEASASDDYGAMLEAVRRHFSHHDASQLDVLLIDGGKGQLNAAFSALTQTDVESMTLIGIAKGETRKETDEVYWYGKYQKGKEPFWSPLLSEAELVKNPNFLNMLRLVRNEAHRFAISSVRKVRDQKRVTSLLQSINGVGPTKRAKLLQHFGSLERITEASVWELQAVEGINAKLAENIVAFFKAYFED